MKGTIKEQRSNHDAHDLLLGILYYFPENAKWDELSFHEALYKISKNYKVLKFLKFKELSGNLYCEDLGKVFDFLELSGILTRRNEFTELDVKLIQSFFDEEIKQTFPENEINSIEEIADELKNLLLQN